MSIENYKSTMIRWFEALNSKNIDLLDQMADEIYTTDYRLHDPGMPDMQPGPVGVKKFTRQILKDSPNSHLMVEDMLGEGDKLATRMSMKIDPGSPVHLVGLVISRFVDGKIAEEWELVAPVTGSQPSTGADDPISLVQVMDTAVNSGDIEVVMACFADQVCFKEPQEGKLLTGKQALREWFQPQMNHIHVDSSNHRLEGNTVTWEGMVSGVQQGEGAVTLKEIAKATVVDGKIIVFDLTFVG